MLAYMPYDDGSVMGMGKPVGKIPGSDVPAPLKSSATFTASPGLGFDGCRRCNGGREKLHASEWDHPTISKYSTIICICI